VLARLTLAPHLTLDPSGNLLFADDTVVSRFNLATGALTTLAGLEDVGSIGFNGDGIPATKAQLGGASGAAMDTTGNLYIADGINCRIRKVAPDGIISTIAGNGIPNYSGDGGPATQAQLDMPQHVAVDEFGNLYISDQNNGTVRKVSRSGAITTVAGNGHTGHGGENVPATSTSLSLPQGIAVDLDGNIFISETFAIRKVAPNGSMTTVRGAPIGDFLAVDRTGNLYVSDRSSAQVRKLSRDGTVTVVAGTGRQGYSGDGGPATAAQLNFPQGIAVDSAGNLYIADEDSYVVRRVSPDGIITTVAGSGSAGVTGDGGPATSARLTPVDVAVDGSGSLYILQFSPGMVRKVTPDGKISTIAGYSRSAFAYTGDGGPALGNSGGCDRERLHRG
jgi:hypothetical protein